MNCGLQEEWLGVGSGEVVPGGPGRGGGVMDWVPEEEYILQVVQSGKIAGYVPFYQPGCKLHGNRRAERRLGRVA